MERRLRNPELAYDFSEIVERVVDYRPMQNAFTDLSERQVEVLDLIIGQNMNRSQAAEAMGISRRTVRTHYQRVLEKFRNPRRGNTILSVSEIV